MFRIVNDFDGANIRVLSQNDTSAHVAVELRDTVGDWFFWCFRVDGAAGKTVTFEFESEHRVGYYGAAVSDDLLNWRWQYNEPTHNGDRFTYTFGANENSVYFAHDMVYRPERFAAFAASKGLQVKTFCTTEKGRAVPYLDFGSGDECILLTSRHHACESSGDYVLEGVLENILTTGLDDKFRVICVPFVDYDGVVDGDQGKNRNNHDHNRDYSEDEMPVYAATREIRRIAGENNIRFAFDFHSPWHLGDCNDTVFIPIKHYSMMKKISMFSNIFEDENSADALPHFAADDYPPDKDWNKAGTPCFGTYMGAEKVGAELAFTLETAYFKAYDVMFTPERAVATGRNFVTALIKYIDRGMRVE